MKMNKYLWIFAILIWGISLGILVIALTQIWADNPFTDFKLVVGLMFLLTSGLLKVAYKKYSQNPEEITQN